MEQTATLHSGDEAEFLRRWHAAALIFKDAAQNLQQRRKPLQLCKMCSIESLD